VPPCFRGEPGTFVRTENAKGHEMIGGEAILRDLRASCKFGDPLGRLLETYAFGVDNVWRT
jgi:hypothetical protein